MLSHVNLIAPNNSEISHSNSEILALEYINNKLTLSITLVSGSQITGLAWPTFMVLFLEKTLTS